MKVANLIYQQKCLVPKFRNFCFQSIFAFITSLRKAPSINFIYTFIWLVGYFNFNQHCLKINLIIFVIIRFFEAMIFFTSITVNEFFFIQSIRLMTRSIVGVTFN